MERRTQRITLYAGTGVLVAALIISGVLLSGIQLPGITTKTGTLIVLLTDKPVELTRLELTINSFSVFDETDKIPLAPPFADGEDVLYIENLLALQFDVTEHVVTASMPAGNYVKMRIPK